MTAFIGYFFALVVGAFLANASAHAVLDKCIKKMCQVVNELRSARSLFFFIRLKLQGERAGGRAAARAGKLVKELCFMFLKNIGRTH